MKNKITSFFLLSPRDWELNFDKYKIQKPLGGSVIVRTWTFIFFGIEFETKAVW